MVVAEIISLRAEETALRVSPAGGAVVDGLHCGIPFLRQYAAPADSAFNIVRAASFPLVPFGNRLENNMFSFGGTTYRLEANVSRDPFYLHGDAWLGDWEVLEKDERSACFVFQFSSSNSPYAYRARQTFAVAPGAITIGLEVRNDGAAALPFGLGHHFHLPLTPETTLCAAAQAYWTERQGHLPDKMGSRSDNLVFDAPRRLPRRWINNGFEGWDGRAVVSWPENGLSLSIEADRAFGRYFLFLPHGRPGPGGVSDYFCFEPMTHMANGHHLPDLGGLRVLEPGETLSGRLRLTLHEESRQTIPPHDERHTGS